MTSKPHCRSPHNYEEIAVSESGKRFWKCKVCGYKTDFNPKTPEPRTAAGSLD